jgi:hypothetical protein
VQLKVSFTFCPQFTACPEVPPTLYPQNAVHAYANGNRDIDLYQTFLIYITHIEIRIGQNLHHMYTVLQAGFKHSVTFSYFET